MENGSHMSYLTLDGFVELNKYRYLYFVITFVLYSFIICCNAVTVSIIYIHRSLHEPMYIFIACLCFNALWGTTAFYPKFLVDLLSEKQLISYPACKLQSFLVYTFAVSEFTLLTAMAYDRYVSICKPLQYVTIVNMHTVGKLLLCSWSVPSVCNFIGVMLSNSVSLCKLTLNRLYCDNYSVVKLGCTNTNANTIFGLLVLALMVGPAVMFVIFSYVQIVLVVIKSSPELRRKAIQTCLPHVLVFMIYTINCTFEMVQTRLDSEVPHLYRMFLSIQGVVIPPLLNPIIYGLKLQELSTRLKKLICPHKEMH
ncbi:olfactory receptor 6N2-like [Denticeps clupeoides]|uniref:G-protein coupled receptors family 1 profile domain-containing protein n=1 Tax=Denticeps clupeoides TaxID=299321 RepID=A0A8C4A857_9TELE|nr:olfactory receptor 6N2-like [Denticeps clupeoides]XP_028821595.1 olfactory receptor 6N2-like [Denticeps clupeoides]